MEHAHYLFTEEQQVRVDETESTLNRPDNTVTWYGWPADPNNPDNQTYLGDEFYVFVQSSANQEPNIGVANSGDHEAETRPYNWSANYMIRVW